LGLKDLGILQQPRLSPRRNGVYSPVGIERT
jgi:hypothetical protein